MFDNRDPQVRVAFSLCEALGLSTKPGEGNISTMLLGVRAYKVSLHLLSPYTCAVHGTSRGPCHETAYYLVHPNHSGIRPMNLCVKHAARSALQAGKRRKLEQLCASGASTPAP